MNLCTHANAQPGDPFCPDCGANLLISAASSPALHCRCGAVVPRGDKFCDTCGATLHHAPTPRQSPTTIPFVAPSARSNVARCVQCGAATNQNALLCPGCQQRAASSVTPPSFQTSPVLSVTAPAGGAQSRKGGLLVGAMTLILVIGSGYVVSLKSQNARLQAQAQVQSEPVYIPVQTAPTQPEPQYVSPQTFTAPPVSQQPSYQPYSWYQSPLPDPQTERLKAENDAREARQREEDNTLVVWECRHCKKQMTRAKKDGMPHDMFDNCPALNYVAPGGRVIQGGSHSWIKVAGP